MKRHVPLALLLGYIVLFIVLGIHPHDRAVWWAENLPILAIVGLVTWLHRRFTFSNTALLLMSVLVVMHTVGGHYTFSRVPFGWVTETFGFQRNHYDRVAHFSVGFYAYGAAEVLLKRGLVRSRLLLFTWPLFLVMSVAAGYELFEWQFAVLADPAAGAEVLGSQGDVWDAQRDMLADTLGALAALAGFGWTNRRVLRSGSGSTA
jgi:putative membrane protein